MVCVRLADDLTRSVVLYILALLTPRTCFTIFRRWIQKWTELVPILMLMKSDCDNNEKENDPQRNDDGECLPAASYLNERGEDYQEQIGMPDEENMRSWSHHHSTDTVDDPIFRAAMRGYDTVSFVFGLEVTWSLIQQRQQDEEERQAMLELESMKEMNESFAMKDCALKEADDDEDINEDEEEDERDEQNQDGDEMQDGILANTRFDDTESIIDGDSHDTKENESASLIDQSEKDRTFALLEDSQASCAKTDAAEPEKFETHHNEITEQASEAVVALTAAKEKKALASESSEWKCEVSCSDGCVTFG